MPDSMYDKLGELLSEAIESGNFFYEKEHSSLNIEQKSYEEEREKKICIDSVQWKNKKKPYEKNPLKNKILLKDAGTEIQKAAAIIGITDEMSLEDAKKQFRKKLIRFHPDKNADNEIMRKITKEKTEQILSNWKILEEWFSKILAKNLKN